ncbi:MAG: transposase [Patescibacteria group bacterium]
MKNIFIDNERESLRLRGYDYSQEGAYFVTICTDKMKCVFGRIIDGRMNLNELGFVAKKCWLDIPKHFSNIKLDAYVIMPNHIHGIFVNVGAKHLSPRNGFKIGVTKWHRNNYQKNGIIWQKNYYEHIIRDDNALNNIRNYIRNNPLKWQKDDFW